MSLPLEPTPEQRRLLLDAASRLIDDFYAGLDLRPVAGEAINPDELTALGAGPPEEGRPLPEVLDILARANRYGALHPAGGHMAYIPNAGLFAGAAGAFLGAALNRYTGVARAAPGLARLEETVIRWLIDLFELGGETAAGVLLSGGSMANFTALVAARTARLPDDFLSGTIYASPHAHHSIAKAARLAGFPADAVRTVAVDADLRMDPDSLLARLGADRAEGRTPFLVVGSAGTTDSGAVDPLADLAGIALEQGLWLHVDGAYGGFFQLTERGRKRLVGIGAADSITLDPHKGLSIPFGVGALLVRHRETLLDVNTGFGAYLGETDDSDFSALGPELTRPSRGLHVWLPLQLHGVAPFRANLDRMLDLAGAAYERVSGLPGVERVWKPDLSIVAFQAEDDDRARLALRRVNASGRAYLSSTTIAGRFTIRLALLNRRTQAHHVDDALDVIAATLVGTD